MNPDLSNIDTSNASSMLMGMNMSPTHLLWTTIATLVISHFGANYLKNNTPRGYMFWFTILNIVLSLMFF